MIYKTQRFCFFLSVLNCVIIVDAEGIQDIYSELDEWRATGVVICLERVQMICI